MPVIFPLKENSLIAFGDRAKKTIQRIFLHPLCWLFFSFVAVCIDKQTNMSFVKIFAACKSFLLIALLLSIRGTCVFAGDKLDTTKVYSIKEIIVTEHYKKNTTRASAPLQIISSNQLGQLNALQISDAVKFFSGVSVKDYGGIGGLKTVSVRSLGAEHTAVNLDGITVTDCQTGQIDIGRFSLDNVETLSLNSGQSDNIFQPSRQFASGSVLNIVSKRPDFENDKNLNGKISVKGGSFGLMNPAFLLQKKISNKYALALNGEWVSANGEYPYTLNYSYQNNGISSREIRKNSDVNQFRLEGNVYATFSDKSSAFLKNYYFTSDRGLPGATIFYNEGAFTSQRLKDNSFFSQFHYQNDMTRHFAFQVNAKYQHGFVHYTDSASLNAAGYEDSRYKQNEFYTSASFLYRVFEHFSLNFSADAFVNNMFAAYENEALTADFAQPTRYNLLSVLAVKYANEQLLITGSLLSTNVIQQTVINTHANNYNRISPYMSFSYQPFSAVPLRLRAFYKNIFRLPTFNDLYFARTGNADLRPETTHQFNIGGTYAFTLKNRIPYFSLSVDYYKNSILDKIVAMPTKNVFIWSMTNLGKVNITGIDIAADGYITLSEQSKLSVGGTYTYQKALDVTTTESETYTHQIPYTPRISGSGKVALESTLINVGYTLLWSGPRYAGYQNYTENRLKAYADHSLSASREFKLKRIKLLVKAEVLNILNRNYEIIRYFPMPGRSFRATLNLNF